MSMVKTVCGLIDSADLGATLMHEHVVSSWAGIPCNYPQLYRKEWIDTLVGDLKKLKASGINTVVDATPFDLGRDPTLLKEVSEKSEVNIIATTGFFLDFNRFIGRYCVEDIAGLFIDDIERGMAGTNIRAGLIKAAMDKEGATPGRELLHRAAAQASIATGVPIFLHSDAVGQTGIIQLDYLKAEGAKLSHVKVDHCLDTTDMPYLQKLYEQGVWLGVDRLPRLGKGDFIGEEDRMQTIFNMLQAGMSDKMLFSHDTPGMSTFYSTADDESKGYFQDLDKGYGWCYITSYVFPIIESMGISGSLLRDMLTVNPRKFFEV